eukprot:gene23212-20030_t
MIWSRKCSRTALLAACVAFLAQPCNGLDGTIGCSEFNGDVFLTTSGSAVERAGIAVELGKLASACHQATAEEEEIDDEPIGLADWPDDDALSVIIDLAAANDASKKCVGTSMLNASVARFTRFRQPGKDIKAGFGCLSTGGYMIADNGIEDCNVDANILTLALESFESDGPFA